MSPLALEVDNRLFSIWKSTHTDHNLEYVLKVHQNHGNHDIGITKLFLQISWKMESNQFDKHDQILIHGTDRMSNAGVGLQKSVLWIAMKWKLKKLLEMDKTSRKKDLQVIFSNFDLHANRMSFIVKPIP